MSLISNHQLNRRGVFVGLFTLITALVTCASVVRAELRVCNATPSRVGLAIGYQNQNGRTTTEGWWNIPAQTCETLLKSRLHSRYVYVYAVDYERGGQWTGTHTMCITSRSFMIRDIKNCEERGHRKVDFFKVDTGDAAEWTIRLTDPDKATDKTK